MIWLIFAHFIGDWALQSNWMAENKQESGVILVAHCMIWTACIYIAMTYTHINLAHWKLIFLLCGHFVADIMKCLSVWMGAKPFGLALYIDQLWHLGQCAIVYSL